MMQDVKPLQIYYGYKEVSVANCILRIRMENVRVDKGKNGERERETKKKKMQQCYTYCL